MKLKVAIMGIILIYPSIGLSLCNPAACVPNTGCTWRSTTRICSNSNVCSGGTIHNIVVYANCTVGSCNAGCTPFNMCAVANTPLSCGACDQTTDNNTGTVCGFTPPPACSDDPSCACGSDTTAASPGLCPCLSCSPTTSPPVTAPPTIPPTIPPTVPPTTVPPTTAPVGPCGPLSLCGQLLDVETNTIPLINQIVEVRDSTGKIVADLPTDSNGRYSFTPLLADDYFIVPVVDRMESAIPLQQRISLGSGTQADFQIRYVPAKVTVAADVGTFILFTPYAFTGTTPPVMQASAPLVITATADMDGMAKVRLPGGMQWWYTCWKYQWSTRSFQANTAAPVQVGQVLPQQNIGPLNCI